MTVSARRPMPGARCLEIENNWVGSLKTPSSLRKKIRRWCKMEKSWIYPWPGLALIRRLTRLAYKKTIRNVEKLFAISRSRVCRRTSRKIGPRLPSSWRKTLCRSRTWPRSPAKYKSILRITWVVYSRRFKDRSYWIRKWKKLVCAANSASSKTASWETVWLRSSRGRAIRASLKRACRSLKRRRIPTATRLLQTTVSKRC